MQGKGFIFGAIIIAIMVFITSYTIDNSRKVEDSTQLSDLVVIEESARDLLTEDELLQLDTFAKKAIRATEKDADIYSPHAKFLDDKRLLVYLLLVNNSGREIRSLSELDLKVVSRYDELIASAYYPEITVQPQLPIGKGYLFAVLIDPESIKMPHDTLSSYMTQAYFSYD